MTSRTLGVIGPVVVGLVLLSGCSAPVAGSVPVGASRVSSVVPAGPTDATSPGKTSTRHTSSAPGSKGSRTGTAPSPGQAAPTQGSSSKIRPVRVGELTGLRVVRGSMVVLSAASSGLARYNASPRCEVPGQPCYDAPFLDRVARIDLGAPPTVPGRQTTFITGHSNRFHPDDPSRGVFSRLQTVRRGDSLVLTTAAGRFVYRVSQTLEVPFDELTSTPAVVTVRADTVVAISCVISPSGDAYTGNFVVVATLVASTPL
ncbi:MAG: hypothetical protein JWP82_747 [Humibacillus sp.]|nr:hypothetical protein [Humibacillus sp.]